MALSLHPVPFGLREAQAIRANCVCPSVELKRGYFNRLVHTWNVIPTEVRGIVDEYSFKRMFNLFNSYFNDNYEEDDQCTWHIICRCNNH